MAGFITHLNIKLTELEECNLKTFICGLNLTYKNSIQGVYLKYCIEHVVSIWWVMETGVKFEVESKGLKWTITYQKEIFNILSGCNKLWSFKWVHYSRWTYNIDTKISQKFAAISTCIQIEIELNI